MNAIELMMDEHKDIKRMLLVVRKACFKIFEGEEINYKDFELIIKFIKSYADSHHHKKEEKILFDIMLQELGSIAEKTVKHGMLVEHDLGRLHIKELEEALVKVKNGDKEAILDVIANAISYTHLLERHITKEDNVIYKFAQRELSSELLDSVNQKCIEFENENNHIKQQNISILNELEKKYTP